MTLMDRRRALMAAAKKARLPSIYQEVEWIEGNKAPAIITPIWLTLDTEIETVAQHMEYQTLYLQLYGRAAPSIGISYAGPGSVYASFGNVSDSAGGSKNWQGNFHKFVQNKDGWWLDDVLQKQYNASGISGDQSRLIAVFARLSGNNTLERFSWWRIKYFIIRHNGDVVCYLIPCYRKADNMIGMYDTVSNQFLTNAGTGEFTKGADVN